MRCYDDPNHAFYGPARRCCLMLALMCPDMELLDRHYRYEWHVDWDHDLMLLIQGGSSEAMALRTIVWRAIDIYPD